MDAPSRTTILSVPLELVVFIIRFVIELLIESNVTLLIKQDISALSELSCDNRALTYATIEAGILCQIHPKSNSKDIHRFALSLIQAHALFPWN